MFRRDMTKPCVEAGTLTKNEKQKVSRRKCLFPFRYFFLPGLKMNFEYLSKNEKYL